MDNRDEFSSFIGIYFPIFGLNIIGANVATTNNYNYTMVALDEMQSFVEENEKGKIIISFRDWKCSNLECTYSNMVITSGAQIQNIRGCESSCIIILLFNSTKNINPHTTISTLLIALLYTIIFVEKQLFLKIWCLNIPL